MKKLSLIVFFALLGLCIAQAIYYYPKLPDKVASHFGSSGQPDDWSTKKFFVTFYLALIAILAILFLGIGLIIPKVPPSLVNLPHKDYWLSDEHKQQTNDFLFHYFMWFASATLLLLLDIFYQSFQVNIGKTDTLPRPFLSLGIYIAFTVLWTIGLFIKFIRKPNE